eukprot:CAMPEP_0183591546 /NCGR_PEP_ID=MMETSP0371-20130417/166503_1 /TAXON_ID=268820 /ORGANISM="Peridinium aciculiferum, Strain PAER-2" /LENGTH=52 /DNA_ID=CAMNT_0025803029 /DNA_START=70 /DNA_END=224 /DNA_ORIENTATION=-
MQESLQVLGQPRFFLEQHHIDFAIVQSTSQLSRPTLQSKGSGAAGSAAAELT